MSTFNHCIFIFSFCIALVTLTTTDSSAQKKKDELACAFFDKEHIDEVLILGYHYFDYHYIQLGVGSVTSSLIYPKLGARFAATGPIWQSISMSIEARVGDSLLIAPQLSYWANDIFALSGFVNFKYGINLITYTDTKDGNLVIRPELGLVNYFDWLPFKGGYIDLVYGYNITVLNPGFEGFNKPHNIALRFYLKYR